MPSGQNTIKDIQKAYSAPALEKGLDIIELLAEEKKPMTTPQISAALNRSKSEIYRMLAVLEERGYLRREGSSDYFRITNKLFDLGMSVSPVGTLVESAYPVMHELSESIRQSSHLAVVSGDRIVIIARVESTSVFGFSVKVGRYASLFETTSGAVLLAWMSDKDRQIILKDYAKNTRCFAVEVFKAKLESIRKRGYLEQKSADVTGITDIGFPIFQGDGSHAIACLLVPFLQSSRTMIALPEARVLTGKAAAEISSLAATYHGF